MNRMNVRTMNPPFSLLRAAMLGSLLCVGAAQPGCDRKEAAESGARPTVESVDVSRTSGTQPATGVAGLGRIAFPCGAKIPAAKEHFVRGLLLLHNLEYDDAREEFKQAGEAEKGFVMAAWGEAMTWNHPLGGEQDRAAGLAALSKIAADAEARAQAISDPREKAYVAALDVLFADGSKADRDAEYRDEMLALMAAHPDDDEAACFATLSVLGACEMQRDTREYMHALSIVQDVLSRNPDHPGAMHILIHCVDDPDHAQLGLKAARHYAQIAGGSSRALLMPARLFMAMGLWDEAASAATASIAASDAAMKQKKQPGIERDYKALRLLHYAQLQLGMYPEAQAILLEVGAEAGRTKTPKARWHYAQMRALHVLESPESKAELPAADTHDLEPSAVFADLFVVGYLQVKAGQIEAASTTLGKMDQLIKKIEPRDDDDSTTQPDGADVTGAALKASRPEPRAEAAGKDFYGGVAKSSAGAGRAMASQLDALIQAASGDTDAEDNALQDSVDAAAEIEGEYGPPMPPMPVHELMGMLLAREGKTDEAEQEYEIAIHQFPGRIQPTRALADLREKK